MVLYDKFIIICRYNDGSFYFLPMVGGEKIEKSNFKADPTPNLCANFVAIR